MTASARHRSALTFIALACLSSFDSLPRALGALRGGMLRAGRAGLGASAWLDDLYARIGPPAAAEDRADA